MNTQSENMTKQTFVRSFGLLLLGLELGLSLINAAMFI